MMDLYNQSAFSSSRAITKLYSTSFSLGIKSLDAKYRDPIYGIYGFVRYADEIVDTFYDKNQYLLFQNFKRDTYEAIEQKISLNPVLHSFQLVVNKYNIEKELIEAFLYSMELDLTQKNYSDSGYTEYIYGSAEVVGLMCLHVFTEGNNKEYENLKPYARRLGAAFQKVNFLRDVQSDFEERGRVYFPGVDFHSFTNKMKSEIEADIEADFKEAWIGIKKLPKGARFGVYLAYVYYLKLFKKIKKVDPSKILKERIRITDNRKLWLLTQTYVRNKFNFL